MSSYRHSLRRARYKLQMALAGSGPGREARLRDALAGKHLVFCLTNGRSGSNRLGDLFKVVRGVDARHEPAPYFDTLRRQAARDPAVARDFLLSIKLPYIAGLAAPTYVETSHLLAKGYFRPLLATGIPFDCILLTRDIRKTALSLLSLGTLPGVTTRFLISPDEAEYVPSPPTDQLTPYQLHYWHVLESEARSRAYAKELRAAGGRVAEVTLESLDAAVFRRLLADLGMDPAAIDEAALTDQLARRVNEKSHKRRPVTLTSAELDEQEQALIARLPSDPKPARAPRPAQ